MLSQLIHNGIVVPDPPAPRGLKAMIRGVVRTLTPKEEEMLMAFAAKKDTEYVRDDAFVANFLDDLSAEMGISPPLRIGEVDWGPLHRIVDDERLARQNLSPEERKAAARARKEAREALKARYGYAIVNGRRVELGNYMVEPSGIFMGRGQHPLRGRWKEGARQCDVTLNHSDPAQVTGGWAEIVWQPESLWVARWQDKLSGKLKYIWLSDTAPVRQEREEQKFDKARRLEAELERVRARIADDLQDEHPELRRIATVCYLIDALCLRVGDEKDPDEADTVGATTLRREHVRVYDDKGTVEFHFLGKDSVEWHRTVELPDAVRSNLMDFIAEEGPARETQSSAARGSGMPQIFPDVSSQTVNGYLSRIVPGLSAKVFRTHHATAAVEQSLSASRVRREDPEYCKWRAASLANIDAARLCNHNKKETADSDRSEQRYRERHERAAERLRTAKEAAKEARAAVRKARAAAEALSAGSQTAPDGKTTSSGRRSLATARRRLAAAQARQANARQRQQRAEEALRKLDAQREIAVQKRSWNLSTSLKSYIDPRVYYKWGKDVNYDVLERYYPTTLRRKFLWVRAQDDRPALTEDAPVTVRACMQSDMSAVVALFGAVLEEHPELDLPMSATEATRRYLPRLGGEWKEAAIAVDGGQSILAFVALGPEWSDTGSDLVDVLAVSHPLATDAALPALLADHVIQALTAYNALTPRRTLTLRPKHPAWLQAMPDLADAFGLAEEEPGDVPIPCDCDDERADAEDKG